MSRRVFFRDSEAQGFTTYGLLLDTLFRQLKTVGIAGYFPYEYREDMSCDYAELVSFFGEEFGRLAEQEADASNLSILSKHVSLRGILLERYRKDNERYLAARNSLSIGRLKKVEDKNEPSWAELVASAENEDKQEAEGTKESEEAEGAGIQDSDKGQQNSAAMNSFLAAIKSAHAVDDSVAPEYVEEDDEEPVSGYSSEEDWDEDEDPSVLPADEDEEEGEEDSEEDEGYDVLPADDDEEEEDPSVLPDDGDEEDEAYSSELPADEDEEESSILPEDDDEDDEEYSSELPADEDSDEDAGYSSELPEDDDEEDSSVLPEDEDDEEYSSELPADDDEDEDEEYSSELPADEDEEEDDGYSSELPEDDDEDYSSELPEDEDDDDYSSELPEDDDEDYSSELPEDDDDGDSGVLPDDDDEPAPFKSAPQPKAYTSPMMSYSAPVSSMVVRPSYARGIPGRETQEAVLDMMNKLANNIKGWFSRL